MNMKKILSVALIGGLLSVPLGARSAIEDSPTIDADTLLEMLGSLAEEQVEVSVEPAPAPKEPVVEVPVEPEPAPKEPVEEKLPEVAPPVVTNSLPRESRPTKITSRSAVYNRKEGLASFSGQVHLDDQQYQLHADRVYVFTTESNEVKRVVALGRVAMTNELRCAYGAKVTYSRPNGLVVLYSGDGITAEVVDHSKEQPQTVKGEKIRFWIDSEQVEVLKADISGPAPAGTLNADALKNLNGK